MMMKELELKLNDICPGDEFSHRIVFTEKRLISKFENACNWTTNMADNHL